MRGGCLKSGFSAFSKTLHYRGSFELKLLTGNIVVRSSYIKINFAVR